VFAKEKLLPAIKKDEVKQSKAVGLSQHAILEKKHEAEAIANKLERQNPQLPMVDRAAAATREAGHDIAATYHAAAKQVDKS
jgi:hypothetical protein